jgi:hypothetical protein
MCYNNGKPGQGKDCLLRRVSEGARWLNADEGFLTGHYAKLGFSEVCRGAFGPEFFPERWDVEKHGTPDVVFMAHDFLGESAGYMKTWDEAVELMDSLK